MWTFIAVVAVTSFALALAAVMWAEFGPLSEKERSQLDR
jgi:hypothetical protein